MTTALDITCPKEFHFEHTVLSHGWCALFPFVREAGELLLTRTTHTPSGKLLTLEMRRSGRFLPSVSVRHKGRLPAADRRYCETVVRDMLFVDLDLRSFYRMIRKDEQHSWMAKKKAGRMLRGETLFEDVVKMILTTNCSWGLTTAMNRNLIASFGIGSDLQHSAFPLPEAIADSSEEYLRKNVKLGYRSPYILELARRCSSGELNIEALRRSDLPAAELYSELRAIKGVGEYAAGNLLKLLGRFDYLGLDSWCRSSFSKMHANGGSVTDSDIEHFYAPYDEWKGLVLWLDISKEWYTGSSPL